MPHLYNDFIFIHSQICFLYQRIFSLSVAILFSLSSNDILNSGFFFFLIELRLIDNVMLVFSVQQGDSVILLQQSFLTLKVCL